MMLIVCAAAHLLTDAVCAASLFGQMHDRGDFYLIVILYNTLAFSTQAIVGLLADRKPDIQPYCGSGAMALVALGFFLPVPAILKTVMIGLGNSVFHVACGQLVLIKSRGRAADLGTFVAPGAIRLSLGTLFPEFGVYYAAGLLGSAVLLIPVARRAGPFGIENTPEPEKPVSHRILKIRGLPGVPMIKKSIFPNSEE